MVKIVPSNYILPIKNGQVLKLIYKVKYAPTDAFIINVDVIS